MKRPKLTIKEINIGDELIYKDKYREGGFPNWKVVSKLDESLIIIEINDGIHHEKKIIELSEIIELISSAKH